jgi:hypothetical protein
MEILHHFGVVESHKEMCKGKEFLPVVREFLVSEDNGYRQIGIHLERFHNSELPMFKKTLPGMEKEIGKSQYKDGLRITQEFFRCFNPEHSPYHVARGGSREILVWFNGKIFDARYSYENQQDSDINLQRIGFRKPMIDEFNQMFPDMVGKFTLYKGQDENHFVIESDVTLPLPDDFQGEMVPRIYRPYHLQQLNDDLLAGRLIFSPLFIKRFTALLLTKPFLLLTGLTGSGKTRIALTFAQWITEEPSQYAFIPVGSDWTNREPLLGYPNALEEGKYVKPDNGVLDLLLAAAKDRERPYFLILDEMNLSHVERYFADFLSAMESAQPIPLHADTGLLRTRDGDEIPSAIELPANLFIIGTVNIDETTYMFSPKVLDRAGVLEFRVDRDDMDGFLSNPVVPDTLSISGRGAPMAAAFLRLARQPAGGEPEREAIGTRLITFFDSLKPIGAEFGYRTAAEIFRYAGKIRLLEEQPDPANPPWDIRTILDTAIVQKLLPKVHGSRRRVIPVLKTLAQQCVADGATLNLDAPNFTEKCEPGKILYPVSFEKICRMYDRAISDGFTSFAEA